MVISSKSKQAARQGPQREPPRQNAIPLNDPEDKRDEPGPIPQPGNIKPPLGEREPLISAQPQMSITLGNTVQGKETISASRCAGYNNEIGAVLTATQASSGNVRER